MKKLLIHSLAFLSLLGVAYAGVTTFSHFYSPPSDGASNTLTIKAGHGETVQIPKDAVLTVLDADGVALDPQPSLGAKPKGKDAKSITVTPADGDPLPKGYKIHISDIETTDDSIPTGKWSSGTS